MFLAKHVLLVLNWRDDASPRDSARDSCAYILSAVLLRICSPFKGEIVSSTLPYCKINMARSSTGTLHQHTQGDICDASYFSPRNMVVWLTAKTRKRVTNQYVPFQSLNQQQQQHNTRQAWTLAWTPGCSSWSEMQTRHGLCW